MIVSSSVAAIKTTTPAMAQPTYHQVDRASATALGSFLRRSRGALVVDRALREVGQRGGGSELDPVLLLGVFDSLLEDLVLGLSGDLRATDHPGIGTPEALGHLTSGRNPVGLVLPAQGYMYDTLTGPTHRGETLAAGQDTAAPRIQTPPQAGRVFGASVPHGIGGLGGSTDGPIEEIHVFWLAGMSCDGCSVAVTRATSPSVEEPLPRSIPRIPKVFLHHPVLAVDAGASFIEPFGKAVEGTLGAPYVVVLEGSIPDDQAFENEGYFSGLGVGSDWPDSMESPRADDQPLRVTDWI